MSEAKDLNQGVEADPLGPAERARSNFVRDMVQRRENSTLASTTWSSPTPKRIVQFWNNMQQLPEDVKTCMDSWRQLERIGFELRVFDENSARSFIRNRLGDRHVCRKIPYALKKLPAHKGGNEISRLQRFFLQRLLWRTVGI